MEQHAYAVIMAGGAGTRLWPLSRKERPKPLLRLVDRDRSMFQLAVDRLDPLFPLERILVVAGTDLIPALHEQVPDLPAENFIEEPMGRDTGPAVGLAAIHVHQRNPNALMAVLTADHYIADRETFRQALEAACQVASEGQIVTLGIQPTYPATGFGYIERGQHERSVAGIEVYELKQFVEKPDRERAEAFLETGRYSWNSGMFIWQAARVLDEFDAHAPNLSAKLNRLASSITDEGYDQLIRDVWPTIDKISVDYALMEHINEGVSIIPIDVGWYDIGNFNALYGILAEEEENVVQAEQALTVDTTGSIIIGSKMVATIGLDDMVIVDTDDVLLVCKRDRAQDVRRIVQQLRDEETDQYL